MSSEKSFKMLAVGQLFSLLGSAILKYIISLEILELTGSALSFSYALVLSIIPLIITPYIFKFSIVRLSPKTRIIFLDIIYCISVILFLINFKENNLTNLYLFIVVSSLFSSLMIPSVQSAITYLSKEDEFEAKNGIISSINIVSNFIGPVIASILYGFFEIRFILLLIAIFLLVAILIEFKIKITKNVLNVENDLNDYSMPDKFKFILLTSLFCNMLLAPIFMIVLPYIIIEVYKYNQIVYGISEGLIGLSMIVSGITVGLKSSSENKDILNTIVKVLFKIIYLLAILFLIINFVTNSLIWVISVVVICAVSMFMMVRISINSITYLQKSVDKNNLAYLLAKVNSLSMIALPIGQLIFGYFIEKEQFIRLFPILPIIGLFLVIRYKEKL